MKTTKTLEGHISIRVAIQGKSRPIYSIYIQDDKSQQHAGLAVLAQKQSIPIAYVQSEIIESFT